MSLSIELGLGIVGLGRTWGHIPSPIPTEDAAIELLQFAYRTGVRYFDSAPSYGNAEERLGKFLHSLSTSQRAELRIATKFGEHWDVSQNQPFVDHSFDALRRSLDTSIKQLGRIDILQLHKTTPGVLASPDLDRAWDYAVSVGIQTIGVSVSDTKSAEIALSSPRYRAIQFPLNQANPTFAAIVEQAAAKGLWIAINRPFAMGALLYGDSPISHEDAFRFVLQRQFTGVVLTGTTSKEHLLENWIAFQQVSRSLKRQS